MRAHYEAETHYETPLHGGGSLFVLPPAHKFGDLFPGVDLASWVSPRRGVDLHPLYPLYPMYPLYPLHPRYPLYPLYPFIPFISLSPLSPLSPSPVSPTLRGNFGEDVEEDVGEDVQVLPR